MGFFFRCFLQLLLLLPLRTMALFVLLFLLVLHPPLATPQGDLQLESASNSATNPTSSAAIGPVSFSFPSFSLGPLLREEGQDAFVPRLSRLRRVEVGTVEPDVRTRLGLLEYILLNIDFNYDKQVPNSGRLQFRYCC